MMLSEIGMVSLVHRHTIDVEGQYHVVYCRLAMHKNSKPIRT